MAYLSSDLAALVDEAYRALERPAPAETGVCTACCLPEDQAARMLSLPLRDLDPDLVRRWTEAAAAPDLGQEHVLWLLPRVLDLLAQEIPAAWIGPQVVFQHMERLGGIRAFPAPACDLFQRFAEAHILACATAARAPQLEEHLCMYARAGADIGEVLRQLDTADPGLLARAITASWMPGLPIGHDAFWDGHPARDEVCAWFASPALAHRLTTWGRANPGQARARVHAALDILQG